MTSPHQAYLNGRFIPASQAGIALHDAGFVLGATVTEQLRTFGGRLFRTEQHLDRLCRSLEIVGIEPGIDRRQLGAIAEELAATNHALVAEEDDLGMAIFVTPGPYRAIAGGQAGSPTVGLHTFPLAFELWADKYGRGQRLVTTDVRQVPAECWPPGLKCRSRMHYYLADREASRREPGARALLLDTQGRVTETATSNIVIYRLGQGLLTPPGETVLRGITLDAVAELARSLDIPFSEQDLSPADVAAADEVLLTSTPTFILPVTSFNGRPLGDGRPGPQFTRLLQACNDLVGIDIAAQAARCARREFDVPQELGVEDLGARLQP